MALPRHSVAAAVMPIVVLVLLSGCTCGECAAPSSQPALESNHQVLSDALVEASCGQCQFGMAGEGCDLAVRLDGASYYVDGSHIDGHGDAHAHDGLCNAVRDARVSGEVVNGRVRASSFELVDGGGTP